MKSMKMALLWSAVATALLVAPGVGPYPAEGKQWKRTAPSPRFVLPFAGRRAARIYHPARKCRVPAETQAEQSQKSTARRLCNSAIVDERAEGTSSFQ
jgi:hypothetical protein